MNGLNKFFAVVVVLLFFSVTEAVELPKAPDIQARSYLLYDMQAKQILTANGLDEQIEPASLTKLMTAYLAFQNLKEGRLNLNQMLTVSNAGYKAEGSRMFLELRKPASVDDVLKGLIIQSGNDAAITLAESISGDEANFATTMNEAGAKLGMKNTQFRNSTGLPAEGHFTTIRDLLILSSAIIEDYPEYYPYYATKSFTYNRIKQNNRNLLLYRDATVDGLKTGHTSSAGYNLIVSSKEGNRRLIAIVTGTASDKARIAAASTLLQWGKLQFVNQKVYDELQSIQQVRVYKGDAKQLEVGFLNDTYITIPVNAKDKISQEIVINNKIVAPIARGQEVGYLEVKLDGVSFQKIPILALQKIGKGGLFRRFLDSIALIFHK